MLLRFFNNETANKDGEKRLPQIPRGSYVEWVGKWDSLDVALHQGPVVAGRRKVDHEDEVEGERGALLSHVGALVELASACVFLLVSTTGYLFILDPYFSYFWVHISHSKNFNNLNI